MTATTTPTIHLIDCPACKGPVIADLTYSVKLNPPVYAEGGPIPLIDKAATATLTLTGVRIQHECPPKTLHQQLHRTDWASMDICGPVANTHNPAPRED